jgi:hypothetical protein
MNNSQDIKILEEQIFEIKKIVPTSTIVIIRHDPINEQLKIDRQLINNRYTFDIKPFQNLLYQEKVDLVIGIRAIILKILNDSNLENNYRGDVS